MGSGIALLLGLQTILGMYPEASLTGLGMLLALILYYVARFTETLENAVEGESSQ